MNSEQYDYTASTDGKLSSGGGQAGQPAPQFYRRRLPHWQPDGAVLFVTFRLFGSLPEEARARLVDEAEMLSRELVKADESPRDRALRRGMRLFALLDEALDGTAISTPDTAWLSNPRIAGLVRDAILFWDGDRYHLHRYVVMPNHVHLLFEPLPFRQPSRSREVDEARPWPLGKIMQGLKGYTAREANRIRGRGGTFWQDESYDHWIRDNASYDAVTAYIDLNPVAAGLCQCPEEWPWSSAAGLRTSVEIAE